MADITTSGSNFTSFPGWFQSALQGLTSSAQTTASQPYQPYPNQRIAGFTPDQAKAFQLTRGNVGDYKQAFNAANRAYSPVTNPELNKNTFNSYFNPYQSQVVDRIAQLGNRNLQENVLPGVNATFTGAGQFGGSRNAEFTNRALRDNQEAISAAQGQALAGGFQNQVQNTQNAQGQALQAGQLEQGLGTARQGAGLTDASALSAIGQQKQNQNQQNLNLGYQDFLTQQQWPYQQESFLSGTLSGQPIQTNSTQTSTQPGPSTVGQIGGLATGALGVLGSTGAFGSGGWLGDLASSVGSWFAEGGEVKDDGDQATRDRELMDWWLRYRKTMGYQMPAAPDTGALEPLDGYATGGAIARLAAGGMPSAPKVAAPKMPRAKRPRFGGIASRRMGGIGTMPGGGTSDILPGAPAAVGQRLPGAASPGAASMIRSLSGGVSARPVMA